MTDLYLLPCECGQQLRVLPHQAGDVRRCVCGRSVAIPTLRAIRQLPREANADTAKRPQHVDTWSWGQGLAFAASIPLLLIGLAVVALSLYQQTLLDTQAPSIDDVLKFSTGPLAQLDMENATPVQTWEVWKPLRDLELDVRQTPRYLAHRAAARGLQWRLGVAGAVAVSAALTAAVAVGLSLLRSGRPARPR